MDAAIAIISFVIVTAITPGPNNLLLAASSMRFGSKATIPHLLGIITGFSGMMMLCALGLGSLFEIFPVALLILRIVGSVYLIYLAWKIFGFKFDTTADDEHGDTMAKPLTYVQAVVFQLANPKAWVMSLTAISLAMPLIGSLLPAIAILFLCFSTIGIACNWVWIMLGSVIRQHLHNSRVRNAVNGSLAVLTLLTVGMFWM